MLFKTISRHLIGKPLENTKLEAEQDAKMEGPAYLFIGCLSSVGYGRNRLPSSWRRCRP